MSASYYSKHQSGGIVSVLINDIALVSNLVGNALTNIWMDGVLVITLLFIMLRMDWVLTLVSLSIFPFYLFISNKVGHKVKHNSHMIQDETEEMSAHVQEKVGGYSIVQAFTHEESALDSQSEKLIQEALDRLMIGRTTILIAHRLSTVVGADEIVVMNKGKIIEKGSHNQLLSKNGAYARLYHTQFDEAIGE